MEGRAALVPGGTVTRTEWFGDDLKHKLRAAQSRALVKVAGRVIRRAVPRAPIHLSPLRRSLRFDAPKATPDGVKILLGSFDVEYALYQERGFTSRAGLLFRTRDGQWRRTTKTQWIPGKFFLQRSLDEEVSSLPETLRRELQ